MFQLFEKFKPEYIDRLLKINKRYLVSQTYTRGSGHFDDAKTDLLFTDFEYKGTAEIHYSAVKHDKFASIIDLANPKHKQKVMELLQPGSKYCIYWAIVYDIEDIKKRLDLRYKNNIRRYIMEHTDWRIGADETIKPSLQVVFGELFIILKRGSQSRRIKFEEIEKC